MISALDISLKLLTEIMFPTRSKMAIPTVKPGSKPTMTPLLVSGFLFLSSAKLEAFFSDKLFPFLPISRFPPGNLIQKINLLNFYLNILLFIVYRRFIAKIITN